MSTYVSTVPFDCTNVRLVPGLRRRLVLVLVRISPTASVTAAGAADVVGDSLARMDLGAMEVSAIVPVLVMGPPVTPPEVDIELTVPVLIVLGMGLTQTKSVLFTESHCVDAPRGRGPSPVTESRVSRLPTDVTGTASGDVPGANTPNGLTDGKYEPVRPVKYLCNTNRFVWLTAYGILLTAYATNVLCGASDIGQSLSGSVWSNGFAFYG